MDIEDKAHSPISIAPFKLHSTRLIKGSMLQTFRCWASLDLEAPIRVGPADVKAATQSSGPSSDA